MLHINNTSEYGKSNINIYCNDDRKIAVMSFDSPDFQCYFA